MFTRKASLFHLITRQLSLLRSLCTLLALAAFLPLISNAQPTPTVTINGAGTITLTWLAPTQNVDNTPLPVSDLTAYGIFWGPQSRFSNPPTNTTLRTGCSAGPTSLTSAMCYGTALQVNGGGTTSAPVTIAGITNNTKLYFAVAAQKQGGLISDYSNELAQEFVVSVNAPPKAPVLQAVSATITCTTSDPEITCSITVQ